MLVLPVKQFEDLGFYHGNSLYGTLGLISIKISFSVLSYTMTYYETHLNHVLFDIFLPHQ